MANDIHDPALYKRNLLKRLKHFGIPQAEAAREAGMNPTVFARWFHTDIEPRVSSMIRVEEAIQRLKALRAANARLKAAGRGRQV